MESETLNPTNVTLNNGSKTEQTDFEKNRKNFEEFAATLPQRKGWRSEILLGYGGHWIPHFFLATILYAKEHFQARPDDFFICSFPKAGTTWLKALSYTIANRFRFDENTHPLLKRTPHELVPYVELDFVMFPDSEVVKDKGNTLFATHIPYDLLPESVVDSGCKMVYIWRDPKDTFISFWFFLQKEKVAEGEMLSLEEVFDLFCQGLSAYGSYFDNVLGYWKAYKENPKRILFLKYEEMRADPLPYVKRLAEFMGYGFTTEEEEKGVVEKVVNMCSFETLKNHDVNKVDREGKDHFIGFPNTAFFRKATVGDWKNYLTPEMAARIDGLMEKKFEGTDLIQHNK